MSPLTERAQRSMLIALQYAYGGAPEGPFGTGKTETAKDLSRCLGQPCVVMNTSGSMGYNILLRLFKGTAGSGAWMIFDEFNRLDLEKMSYLATIIQEI